MAESNSKLTAPLQKFRTDLRETLIRTENSIREMRAREVSTKTQKLEKHELCPLCGGPERDSLCPCVNKLQKNGDAGLGQAGGGGGTQPMGLSEKAACSNTSHVRCGYVGSDPVKHDRVEPKLKKHMPSSSAGALAPPQPVAATPLPKVNQELGGAKSVFGAHPAVGGTSKMVGAPTTRKPVHAMGRASVAVSGEIPNAKAELSPKYAAKIGITEKGNKAKAAYGKGPDDQEPAMDMADHGAMNGREYKGVDSVKVKKAEKNPGSASPYGTGGAGHATQMNMPSALKASMAPTAKAELPVVKPAPTKSVVGAKAPKAGKKVDAKKSGTGGEIKGNPLRKDASAMAAKAPEGKGVPGKQPVGQGGGDAHKVASTAKLPPPGGTGGGWLGTKPVPKPAALRNGPAPGTGTGPAAAMSARLRANPAGSQFPMSGDKYNNSLGRGSIQGSPLQAMSDKANLAADKKAGGVGFLRGLMSMFHSQAPTPGAPQQQGQASSQRFHGAMPLKRAETPATEKKPEAPKPQQQGQATSKRFHGALPLRRGELTLSELEEDAKKMEMPAPTGGFGSSNHNRRMLSIKKNR